jgi:hypothetical protein
MPGGIAVTSSRQWHTGRAGRRAGIVLDMEGLSTDRLRLPNGRAPGGLRLVQELVNTSQRPVADHRPLFADLLTTADSADAWLSAALSQWSDATRQAAPAISLGAADLAPLRPLRDDRRRLARRGRAGRGRDPAGAAHRGVGALQDLPVPGLRHRLLRRVKEQQPRLARRQNLREPHEPGPFAWPAAGRNGRCGSRHGPFGIKDLILVNEPG